MKTSQKLEKKPRAEQRKQWMAALLLLSFFVMLFPPFQWLAGDGGVWYFVVSGLIVLGSLWAMFVIDRFDDERETVEQGARA